MPSSSSSSSTNEESIFDYAFDDPKKLETLMGSKGIFAFSLFRNVRDLHFARRAYQFKTGLSKYIELTKREQFKDYVILVYVDHSLFDFSDYDDPEFLKQQLQKSLDEMYDYDFAGQTIGFTKARLEKVYADHKGYVKDAIHTNIVNTKELIQALQQEPNCILCKYTFPTFLIPGTPYHSNFIGSLARFQALAKFPDRRVCIRDADTYFPEIWEYREDLTNSRYSTPEPFLSVAKGYVDYLEQWETNLLKYHSSKDLPFLIAYDTPYKFVNMRQTPALEITRFLAGIVDCLPHPPELFTQADFNTSLVFLKDDAVVYNIRGTRNKYVNEKRDNYKTKVDEKGTTYYGCDEKVLRFLYFEKWRGATVLFYFPYAYMGSNLMYSDPEDETSFLNIYDKVLQESTSPEEKETPLYKAIELFIKKYRTMSSYNKYYLKTPPGQHYFDFIPSYPFFSEMLAMKIYGKVPDNIKGGFAKSAKTRKERKGKGKGKGKGKRKGKSRKNR